MALANPYKGNIALPEIDVPGFEAGGVLLLDVNALCSIEEVFGASGEFDLEALTPKMMVQIFQAGLEEHHGAVDARTAGKIVSALGITKAAELIMLSFSRSFPEAGQAAGDPPKAPPAKAARKRTAGTGTGSSEPGAK